MKGNIRCSSPLNCSAKQKRVYFDGFGTRRQRPPSLSCDWPSRGNIQYSPDWLAQSRCQQRNALISIPDISPYAHAYTHTSTHAHAHCLSGLPGWDEGDRTENPTCDPLLSARASVKKSRWWSRLCEMDVRPEASCAHREIRGEAAFPEETHLPSERGADQPRPTKDKQALWKD